tara:strand:- start:81 stop:617 length:537 start_codon:yes stop_codon:yes gene_type:complete
MRLRKLETVKVNGGKDYVMVDKRIIHSAENFDYNVKIKKVKYIHEIKTWQTSIIVEIKWTKDQKEYNVYEGTASETIGVGMVNKTSALENCYTSALGKAFGSAGIGIHNGTASGDEMIKAINTSKQIDKHYNLILENLKGYQNKYPDFTDFQNYLTDKAINLDQDQLTNISRIWNKAA